MHILCKFCILHAGDDAVQATEGFQAKAFVPKQIERPKAAVTNQAEKKELMQLVTLPKPKKTMNNNVPSQFSRTRKTIIQVASRE